VVAHRDLVSSPRGSNGRGRRSEGAELNASRYIVALEAMADRHSDRARAATVVSRM